MGLFDRLFGGGGGKPATAAYPRRVPASEDLDYVEITGVEGNTVSVALRFKQSVTPRPAPNTDIVFVLDASGSMHELYKSGQVQNAVWSVLNHTLQYDEDGIDFFLHSSLSSDRARVMQVVQKAQNKQPITLDELAAITVVKSIGQIADRAQLNAALSLADTDFGFATIVAPALEAAMSKKKPNGNIFIELVTDGAFNDKDEVKRVISKLSHACKNEKRPNMVRIHITGVGSELDVKFLEELDEGLSAIAPIDIVAFDKADKINEAPQMVFKELEKSFITVGSAGAVQIKGTDIKMVADGNTGVGDPEMLSLERVPQLLTLDVTFSGKPSSFEVDVMFTDNDGDDFQVTAKIPL